MAGRGTDIVLGPEVPQLGGLFILGTERHESRRIDNQLRGRSGRQGDPGESRFYLSLEDDLMRIFGGDRFRGILTKFGLKRGEPLVSPIITKGIEGAQKQVESRNFDTRKHLLDYDDVMNRQREVVYTRRKHILTNSDIRQDILDILDEESQVFILKHFPDRRMSDEFDFHEFEAECQKYFAFTPDEDTILNSDNDTRMDYIFDQAKIVMEEKRNYLTHEHYDKITNWIMLSILDNQWKDHLLNMDRLKDGISLRGYAQKDPLREYQREGFEMFSEMSARIRTESLLLITNFKLRKEEATENSSQMEPPPMPKPKPQNLTFHHGNTAAAPDSKTEQRNTPKIQRNEPCPCGSGKKYKNCCGAGK
jgi:preprotein translocase subunit SecA